MIPLPTLPVLLLFPLSLAVIVLCLINWTGAIRALGSFFHVLSLLLGLALHHLVNAFLLYVGLVRFDIPIAIVSDHVSLVFFLSLVLCARLCKSIEDGGHAL